MDMNMMDKNTFRTNSALVSVGCIEELQALKGKWRQAAGLPGHIPVLTFNLPPADSGLLVDNYPAASFGFHRAMADSGEVLAMRLQLGSAVFLWFAGAEDDEVCAALHAWRAVGRVPVMFATKARKDWDFVFCVVEAPVDAIADQVGDGQSLSQRAPIIEGWRAIAKLASGKEQLSQYATSSFADIAVRHVRANLLLTKRFAELFKNKPLPGFQSMRAAPRARR